LGLLALMATAGMAGAQGTVSGRVTAPNGDPIAYARVTLVGTERITVTNQAGQFRISSVTAGAHQVAVQYIGFQSDTVPVTVSALPAGRLNVVMKPSPLMLTGVRVEGERAGQIRSVNQQRLSETLVNAVSADDIGALPDQNVAEAVQRIPGVAIQTSRGEGRFVSIRGTAPNLNTVTLNGQPLASSAGSRATALDLLPASMVSNVEVTKAITPDMDANSIGGAINISTLTAFDRDRPFLFGKARGLFHQQQVPGFGTDKQPYELDLTAGRRFGPDQTWGILFSGSASRRDFTASVLDPDGWEATDDGAVFPEELETQVENNERDRYGLTTSLDWRPSSRSSLFLRSLYTRTREVVSNSEYEFGFAGDLESQTAAGGRYTAGSAELDLSEDDEKESLFSLSLGGSHRVRSTLNWDFTGTFTRGTLDRFGPDATFETSQDDETRLASTFDVTPYFFTISPDDPGFIANPANYPLRSASWGIDSNREDTWVGSTNLRWDTRVGRFPAWVKAGAKLQTRDKIIDDQAFAYVPSGVNLAPYALPTTGTVQGNYEAFVHGNVRSFSQFFEDNRNNASFFSLNQEATALNAVESDSDNSERIGAAFLMGSMSVGRLSLLAGGRFERTQTTARRYEFDENEDSEEIAVRDRSFSNSYNHLLPAAVLRFDANEHLVLRAAWTNTIGRADYDQLAGFRESVYEPTATPNVFEGSVSEGNPLLKPYESSNLDASIEYYTRSGGLMSLGLFRKRIDNPIYDYEVTIRDTVFEDRQYAELEWQQDRNADAGTLQGLELAWTQPLVFLPGALNGLGISANAAFIKSEVRVPGRDDEKLPFFGQASRVFNLVPYYQRGPVELRFAWTYRGSFLDEVGSEPFEDRYIDWRQTIDLSARLTLPGGRYEFLAQGRNLTNEPEVGYQGIDSRYDVHTLTGRTFTFGLSARY
jgi:TonB-dependent receptor